MNINNSYKDSIENIVSNYSRDIAWLGAIHVSLRHYDTKLIPKAEALLANPERNLIIQNLPPRETRIEFDKTVKLFIKLCKFATSPPL